MNKRRIESNERHLSTIKKIDFHMVSVKLFNFKATNVVVIG